MAACGTLDGICSQAGGIAIENNEYDGSLRLITYTQLFEARDTVRAALRNSQCSQFVGIEPDIRSYCVPALMLGIVSSGRAFVCLPMAEREATRLRRSLRIRHVFTHIELNTVKTLEIHKKETFLAQTQETFSPPEASAAQACGGFAYATTTSGTTGEPKTIRVPHASILPNILDLEQRLGMSASDKIAQLTPLTFDPSFVEIFLALRCGATLQTFSPDLKNDSTKLVEILAQRRTTFIQSTPSLLRQRWSDAQLRKSFFASGSALRILLLGGEDFPGKWMEKILPEQDGPRIFDVYGVSEVSCWAAIAEFKKGDFLHRSLGEELSGTILEVRDEDGKALVEGEGILFIGSDSRICAVDDEYKWPAKNRVFRDTGDCAEIKEKKIYLRGRKDRRVKRYGSRLSLEKIEAEAKKLAFVENCFADFCPKSQSLRLFFTIWKKSANSEEAKKYEEEIVEKMKNLPDVYLPDRTILLEKFELTANGKMSRNSLEEPENGRENLKNSSKIFHDIWQRFLPIREKIGFLDCGGTSLMALRISNELEAKIGREFPRLVGLLLANKNSHQCRAYVDGVVFPPENSPKSWPKIGKQDFEKSDPEREKEKIIPWQKFRASNSFPEGKIDEKAPKTCNIRLEKRYHMEKCVDASPTIFSYPSGKSFVTVGSHRGMIKTAELGKREDETENWTAWLPGRIEASILVVEDFRGIVGSHDFHVYCINLKTSDIAWKFKTESIVKCTAVLCSQKCSVFVGSYDARAYCLSTETGREIWRAEIGGSISATPYPHEETSSVLFATLQGHCVCLCQVDGRVIWQNKLALPVFSGPVVLDTGLGVFCDVEGNLNSMRMDTGEKVWKVEARVSVFCDIFLYTDRRSGLQSLLLSGESLARFDCPRTDERGEQLPVLRFKKRLLEVSRSTATTDGRIIVGVDNSGNLMIFRFDDGEILTNYPIDRPVFSSTVFYDDFIVFGCRDNFLYIFSM